MKYWLDTEFLQRGPSHPIELVSIGIVAQDGREYYAQNIETHFDGADTWFADHVYANLDNVEYWHRRDGESAPWRTAVEIACDITDFVAGRGEWVRDEGDPEPEFWGWCCDYDYVVVSQLIGFRAWPNGWPYYFRDIQQTADERGTLLEGGELQPSSRHHALDDARQIRRLWECLEETAP